MSAEQIAVEKIINRAAVEESSKSGEGRMTVKDLVPEATAAQFDEARTRKAEAQAAYDQAATRQAWVLTLGILGLVGALLLMYVNSEQETLAKITRQLPDRVGVPLLWLALVAVAALLYALVFRRYYQSRKDALWEADQKLIAARISTAAGRRLFYQEELFRLSSKAQRIFFDDEQRRQLASKWSDEADIVLSGPETVGSLTVVNSRLNSLRELVSREEREQRDEKRWQNWAILVMVVYVGLLVTSAVLTNWNPGQLEAKVFGVPLSVILWGAAGSLAAILYRFYTEQGRIRFAAEFRWLIARPIIGIIMGAVVYLALFSGLILVMQDNGAAQAAQGAATEGGRAPAAPRMEAFWIISFLAGFSDKFYLGVIDLLVARTVRSVEVDPNTVVKTKERIPEAGGADESAEGKKTAAAAAQEKKQEEKAAAGAAEATNGAAAAATKGAGEAEAVTTKSTTNVGG